MPTFFDRAGRGGCNWISGDVPQQPLRVTATSTHRQPGKPLHRHGHRARTRCTCRSRRRSAPSRAVRPSCSTTGTRCSAAAIRLNHVFRRRRGHVRLTLYLAIPCYNGRRSCRGGAPPAGEIHCPARCRDDRPHEPHLLDRRRFEKDATWQIISDLHGPGLFPASACRATAATRTRCCAA